MSRRKLFKKSQYHELPRTYDRHHRWPGTWREELAHDGPIVLELGCGKAEFSLEMARRHPDTFFMGVDLKTDRMWVAAKQAQVEDISNLGFIWIHLLEIDEFFGEQEVDELWITFPDPFPKKRQVKHRMTNAHFLDRYRRILKPGGTLHYKTDNLALFQYSLEVFVAYPQARLTGLSFDLHGDNALPDDYKILTTYERKFLDLGETINYCSLQFSDA